MRRCEAEAQTISAANTRHTRLFFIVQDYGDITQMIAKINEGELWKGESDQWCLSATYEQGPRHPDGSG
jgi:hypothetical protein